MKQWRIKTEQEFRDQGLFGTSVPQGWNGQGKMSYLYGKPLDPIHNEACEQKRAIKVDSWQLAFHHYTSEPLPAGTISALESASAPKKKQSLMPPPKSNSPAQGPVFDIKRVSEELNELFQERLEASLSAQTESLSAFNNSVLSTYKMFEQRIKDTLPDIVEGLKAEIQKGHITIVIPERGEFNVQSTDHPKMADVVMSLQVQRKAMLVGPAGTGKTYMVADIASRLKLPFYKYSCSRDSSVHDLLGYKQPASEIYLETVFLKAYEEGGVFLVDEYDAMSGDMALFFNGVADGSKFISIPHRDSKPTATKHKDFLLVMCGNTWGKGSIEYSGRDFQDMALMDRFRFCRHYIGYHTTLERTWLGDNYQFAIKLRQTLESLGSYLSTRNFEDIKLLIQMGQSKDQIIEMIGTDLTEGDRKTLINALGNTSFTKTRR